MTSFAKDEILHRQYKITTESEKGTVVFWCDSLTVEQEEQPASKESPWTPPKNLFEGDESIPCLPVGTYRGRMLLQVGEPSLYWFGSAETGGTWGRTRNEAAGLVYQYINGVPGDYPIDRRIKVVVREQYAETANKMGIKTAKRVCVSV